MVGLIQPVVGVISMSMCMYICMYICTYIHIIVYHVHGHMCMCIGMGMLAGICMARADATAV